MLEENQQFIPGPAGPLDARVGTLLAPNQTPRAIAIIFHPHPLFQGSLDNKVVFTLTRAAGSFGAYTIRFNFRGVGQSAGQYGEGVGELEDARSVIGWARASWGKDLELWLLGFSFGAGIAIRAARPAGARTLISVAPPVEHLMLTTDEAPTCPWLVIQGARDEVVSPQLVENWCVSLEQPPELLLWPDVTHFFHGHLTLLRQAVIDFLSAHLLKSASAPPGTVL
ncbi:MAG: alpha/beta hydrolase [Gammaproteobacteria bacterium]